MDRKSGHAGGGNGAPLTRLPFAGGNIGNARLSGLEEDLNMTGDDCTYTLPSIRGSGGLSRVPDAVSSPRLPR